MKPQGRPEDILLESEREKEEKFDKTMTYI